MRFTTLILEGKVTLAEGEDSRSWFVRCAIALGRFLQIRPEELLETLRNNVGAYVVWLLANLGGLLVAYLACATIWFFQRKNFASAPGPELYLITAIITVATTGVSYLLFSRSKAGQLSTALKALWAFLVMIIYGVLIAMGYETPAISHASIWLAVSLILLVCLLWSSLTWLHEQAIRGDFERVELPRPEPPATSLSDRADTLAKEDEAAPGV
jgi:hypothetical protein